VTTSLKKRVYEMKRLVIITVVILLLVPIIGCSHRESNPCVEAPLTERDKVQRAVVRAMADTTPPTETLTPGFITNTINNVRYNNGSTLLPVGDYITGGLESLKYAYRVASDGAVTALTEPDH